MSPSPKKEGLVRKRISNWGFFIFSTAFICYFILYPESLKSLENIRPLDILYLIILHFILLAINTIRFRLILHKCADCYIPLKPWTTLFVQGRFLNIFVPQLGNIYRSVALNQKYNVPYTRYVTTLISMAWISTALNLILAFLLIIILNPELMIGGYNASLLVIILLLAILVGPFAARKTFSTFFGSSTKRFVKKIDEALVVTTSSIQDTSWLWKVLFLSTLVFFFASLTVYLCFGMLGATPKAGEAALFYSILQLSTIIRLTPGNVGPQELAFGLLGSQSSVGMSIGILSSTLFRIGGIIVLTISAFILGIVNTLRQGITPEDDDNQS